MADTKTTASDLGFMVRELCADGGIRDARDAGFALSMIDENVREMSKSPSAAENARRARITALTDALRRYVKEAVPMKQPAG